MSLTFVSANTDFARRGDPRYLERMCDEWGADVLLLQEAKDTHLASALPKGFRSLQDCTGATKAERLARMGAAIAFREDTVDLVSSHLVLGARPFIQSARIGMLTREIAIAQLRERATDAVATGISAHFPPPRFAPLQPGYEKRLREVVARHAHVVLGTDANQDVHRLADRLGLDVEGRGIVGLLTDLTYTGERIRPWGVAEGVTDHPAVQITVHIPKENHR